MKHRSLIALLFLGLSFSSLAVADPVISEFMASNKRTIADEDGEYSDWIEIYNPDAAPVDLSGWFLTDKAKDLKQWQFPAGVFLPSKGYLLLFASSKNRRIAGKTLHTNFDLKAAGEYLALTKPDGITRTTEHAPMFPPQVTDVSFGTCVDSGQGSVVGYFVRPTPGTPNGSPDEIQPVQDNTISQIVAASRPSGTFTESFSLTFSGAEAGQEIRYLLADPNASTGADVNEPSTASPHYSAPVLVRSGVLIRAAVFNVATGQKGPTTTFQYLPLETGAAKNTADFASDLPLIVLDDHGSGDLPVENPTKLYRSALLHFFDTVNGQSSLNTVPTLTTRAGIRVRGNSSRYFPKKSYRINLWDEKNGDAPQPSLGLVADADWDLIGPWQIDTTNIQNVLVYDISRQNGRWAPCTRLAEVFTHFNGGKLDYDDYAGISVLTEKIKVSPERLNITKMSTADVSGDALTGGYIFKIDQPDGMDVSWRTNHNIPEDRFEIGQRIILDTPSAKKVTPEQLGYLQSYIQGFEDALFNDRANGFTTREYTNYIDVDSFIDYHILNILADNVDGLFNSEFFHKDRGGKITAGPAWDFDRAFNTLVQDANPGPRRWDYFNWCFTYDWWGPLFEDPQFVLGWLSRWRELRQSSLSDDNLGATLDRIAAQVGDAAGARDAARWPDNDPGHSFKEKVAALRTWMLSNDPANLGRTHWIDSQLESFPPAMRFAPEITFVTLLGSGRADGRVGIAFHYQVTATNGPTRYAASGLPEGLAVDPNTGFISGMPTQAGIFSCDLAVSNDFGTRHALFELDIAPAPPLAPVIDSALVVEAQAGQPFLYQISASNLPTRYGANALPEGLAVDGGSGLISGVPATEGTFVVLLNAGNESGESTADLVLTVTSTPVDPTDPGLPPGTNPDLPTVTLTVVNPTATMGTGEFGLYSLTLSAPQDHQIVVRYEVKGKAVNGTDYVLLKGKRKFKPGIISRPVKIVPRGDLEGAAKRGVKMTVLPGEGYAVGEVGRNKVKLLRGQ